MYYGLSGKNIMMLFNEMCVMWDLVFWNWNVLELQVYDDEWPPVFMHVDCITTIVDDYIYDG